MASAATKESRIIATVEQYQDTVALGTQSRGGQGLHNQLLHILEFRVLRISNQRKYHRFGRRHEHILLPHSLHRPWERRQHFSSKGGSIIEASRKRKSGPCGNAGLTWIANKRSAMTLDEMASTATWTSMPRATRSNAVCCTQTWLCGNLRHWSLRKSSTYLNSAQQNRLSGRVLGQSGQDIISNHWELSLRKHRHILLSSERIFRHGRSQSFNSYDWNSV